MNNQKEAKTQKRNRRIEFDEQRTEHNRAELTDEKRREHDEVRLCTDIAKGISICTRTRTEREAKEQQSDPIETETSDRHSR